MTNFREQNDYADEIELSARERALRDLFVKEYMLDFDPVTACMRCGFQSVMAAQYATRFMEEPYVQRRIAAEQMRIAAADDEEQQDMEKQRIIAGLLREAHYRGPGSSHAARVAAFAKLASIKGLDKETKAQLGEQSGVMLVPGISNLDEWENIAQKSQEKLAHDSVVH